MPRRQHAATTVAPGPEQRRGGLVGELLLALPPTFTMLGVLLFVEQLTRQRFLFASLASSAFLIYRDPEHRMNSIRVMVAAHLVGVGCGIVAALVFQPGFVASATALLSTIILLVVLNVVHPPAISTSLGFAFIATQERALEMFVLALLMLAVLVVLQRVALRLLRHVSSHMRGHA